MPRNKRLDPGFRRDDERVPSVEQVPSGGRDAWFGGFGGPYSTVVWVGRDDFRSLGHREYGGKAALPIWIDYMRTALKEQAIAQNDPPDGMTQVTSNGVVEWVKVEDLERIQSEEIYNTDDAMADEAAFDIF